MRLIQFTASKVWRGHEQKIIYLYEIFRDKNYVEDQIIVCPIDSELYKVAKEKNLNVIPITTKTKFKSALDLKKISDDFKGELLFIHDSKSHTISVLAGVFCGLKIPMVLCRTLSVRVDTNFFRKWKYNYKGIKKIICITQAVVDVLKHAVKDHSRIVIVGILTDIERFKNSFKVGKLHDELNIPRDYKLIGNIAAFTWFKDHKTWVRTVKELKDRNVKAKYILVGKGPKEAEVKAQVKELGLDDDVYFLGFRTDIAQIMPELDVLLFTSNDEPAGGVILEAYACKTPVVATNAGGIPSLLIHNETGLLAEVGNPVDFADKVQILLNDSQLRERVTKNGYQFLLDNHTKEVIGKKMFDELNLVLQNSKQ
ncbi:glycosyltransferase family 4 protein [Flavobacterium sedimenticola]|uniref:Glycosyltransferase family 4 protein n=1 Tax=Flavobacterium sedimenticola TaxID=3043286 RepID=A0ABT6XR83_9FLAO|nr:glycosyltransferase family 4 protein [Flavobacterium sedimenticola]MDI9257571.1 glycosyltransferase family 4 protein [Flavobacterium sedimenticola]